jgi:competence protein ComEA
MSGSELLTLGLALDPNLASVADLEAIPGIGPVLAKRIVEFREEHGPVHKLETLLEVKGMGPKILEKIRPYVVIIADSQASP